MFSADSKGVVKFTKELPCFLWLEQIPAKSRHRPMASFFWLKYRAPGKGLYVVARNFCLALPGCCLANRAYLFRGLCSVHV